MLIGAKEQSKHRHFVSPQHLVLHCLSGVRALSIEWLWVTVSKVDLFIFRSFGGSISETWHDIVTETVPRVSMHVALVY